MGKVYLPLCYFPTSIVLIDDDRSLLKTLHFSLKRYFNCHTFSDPYKALEFLQQPENNIEHLNDSCFIESEDLAPDTLATQIDLRSVHKIIYDENRFKKTILVISDYKMPRMDGAEFSQKLKANNDIKVLLLTGEADYDQAVNLFNKGIIDKFIQKSSDELLETILENINTVLKQSFIEFTKQALSNINPNSEEMPQCLNEIKFAEYFSELCQEHSIVEYYITDSRGGFLLLDKSGNSSWLTVCTPEDYVMFSDMVATDETMESEQLIKSLNEYSRVPYFFSDEDYQTEPSNWGPFMHPVTKVIEGDMNTYYISHIKNTDAYQLSTQDILSYDSALKG